MWTMEKKVEATIWGFPKIRGTFLGVPIRRTIKYWGLYWSPLVLGNSYLGLYKQMVVRWMGGPIWGAQVATRVERNCFHGEHT